MPKQLMGWQIGVVPTEGEEVFLALLDPQSGEQLNIPLDRENAKNISEQLVAPRVAQPPRQQIVLPR